MKTNDGGAKNYLADDTPVSNLRAKLNSDKMKDRLMTTDEIHTTLKPFNCCDIPQDAFISVIAPRRSGKSTLVESIIHEYRKKHKVDAVFLFSKTDAGFYQIPKQYRFRTLEPLNDIINVQLKVKRFNQKQRKDSDKISSKVIVILDDMIDGNGEMRKNKLLTKLSSMGRHIGYKKEHNDLKNNGIMVILISQIFTGLNPTMRRNCDYVFFTKIPSRVERKAIVEEYLTLKTGRNGLRESYNVYDVVNKNDYQFLCICANKSNKYEYCNYVSTYIANPTLPKERWSGTAEDWKNNEILIRW